MSPPNLPIAADTVSRRSFVRLASLTGVLVVADLPSLSAEPDAKFKAAVIGHTGRGDYGHALEEIFSNHQIIEVSALAYPNAQGLAGTAAKIGAPRSYADYREMLEKERPNLVSIAMRESDQHHAIALATLKAGAHIYCEKPFVIAPVESDEL